MTSNLPICTNALIGRTDILDLITQLLLQRDGGIVTLTGPAGVGKTRLAQAVGQLVSEHFTEGVWFVPLEGITDAAMVLPAIARILNLHISNRQRPLEALSQSIGTQKILLILDNMEHIITSAPDIAQLIALCQQLTILTTSRIPLAIRAEQLVTVRPLELPDMSHHWTVEALQKIPAVQLFVQRAQLRNHAFVLTKENAHEVITICVRMDGLPLALELAAACIPSLSVTTIRSQLDRALPLPVVGFQDMPERHQSLDAAIATSYELLTPVQQALFRQLSVFAGNFTLEAALEITTPTGHTSQPTLTALLTLVYQHLLSVTETSSQHHYHMLETIRSFAYRQLEDHTETANTYEKLYDYLYCVVADQKPSTIMHVDEGWLQRIDTCYDSMVSFLVWSHHTDQWFERRTHLIVGLICYWAVRGHLLEAQKWLDSTRTHPSLSHHPHLHIDVLIGIGVVLAHRGKLEQAYKYHQQAFNLCVTHHDHERLNYTIKRIGYILAVRGKHHEAMHMHERSLVLARELDDAAGIADAHMNLGHLWNELGNKEAAQHALEQSIHVAHQIGAKRILAWSWLGLGHIDQTQQSYTLAQQNYNRARHLFCELHDKRGVAWSTIYLSVITARQGHIEQALAMANESLRMFQTTHDQRGLAWSYYYLSHVNLISKHYDAARDALCQAFRQSWLNDDSHILLLRALRLTIRFMIELNQYAEAVRLVGLADSLSSSRHTNAAQPGMSGVEPQLIQHIQTHLSKTQFTMLWHEGRQSRVDDVIQTLRELAPQPTRPTPTKRVLTRRELDVLHAVAEGLSNQQIASHLTISTGTVRTHLNTIYEKLDVQSRTAAVHSARKLGMLT